MTEKLFYLDGYLKSFTAVVTGCESKSDSFAVTLNRTAFYPEGGGQPSDTGTIGGVSVSHVSEADGEIIHLCASPLAVGEEVTGEIDFSRRFLNMQLHTGEHILSGYINQLTGFDNVGFHMGDSAVTIDFNGLVDGETLSRAEKLANRKIWEDVPVEVLYPSDDELKAIAYRSKKEIQGQVRLVRIPGADTCACCGTHVSRTGEVGLVKIVSVMNYKSGVRITLHAGERALGDYDLVNRSIREAGALLKVKPDEVPGAIEKLLEKLDGVHRELSALRGRLNEAECASIPEGTQKYITFTDGGSADEIRSLCDSICDRAVLAAVFSSSGDGFKYCIGSRTQDVRPIGKALNSALNGRGGGKPEMIQGSVSAREEDIRRFWENI